MSEKIIDRVVSAENDRRIVLKNSQLARTMVIGSTWTKIRVAMRCALEGSATFGPNRLAFGVCSGTAHIWASDYCTHAAAMLFGRDNNTAVYTAGPPVCYNIGGGPYFTKKVSQTETNCNAGSLSTSTCYVAADSANRNCIIAFDLRKTGPTNGWFMQASVGGNVVAGAANKTYAQFHDFMLLPTMTAFQTQMAAYAGIEVQNNAAGGTIDEAANGYLDSVFVYWQNPTVGLEIGDIVVARLA